MRLHFVWRDVLTEHGIRFVEKGANVKRGELNIQCPFCGTADPSHHMGLNPETGYWACWRNSTHRGKSPLRLLTRLLGVSYGRARQIAGMVDDLPPDPDGFDAIAARIMGRDKYLERPEQVRREFLAYPQGEFVPVSPKGASRRFFDYLLARGFEDEGVAALNDIYAVRAAIYGAFKDRVIIPYKMDGELVAWTGRAIAQASIRYKDLPLEDCLVPVKHMLFNYDAMLTGGKVLLVQEGPVDALKVDVYGATVGVRSVAMSTNTMSEEQVYMLEEFAPSFERVVLMLDNASQLGVVDGMRMRRELRGVSNLELATVPYGLKDCGALTWRQALAFTDALSKGAHNAF